MTPGRRLVAICLALLGGALGLWVATRLGWFTTGVDAVGRGRVPVTATGAEVVPALTGVALLAAAAVPAAVALAGLPRRALGVLVAAGGALAGWATAAALLAPPPATDLAALPGAPAGGTPAVDPVALGAGPLPAAVGAALLVVAGAALLLTEPRLPRFGGRFVRESRGSSGPAQPKSGEDPDRAAWDALDAGRDPTLGPTPDPTPDPARGENGYPDGVRPRRRRP